MTFIIAEIGVNHQGNAAVARTLIDEAVNSGADAVKFQTFDAERLEPEGPRRTILSNLMLIKQVFLELREYAESKNVKNSSRKVEFISTPFSVEDLCFLQALGMKKIKISSGSLDDERLLRKAGDSQAQLIISTGMSDMDRVRTAVFHTGRNYGISLLHCTSAYPTPLDEVNLRAMTALRREFLCPVGLSDHTLSIHVPVAAVALGAKIIEKHLTLSRDMGGPDHHMSLEPHEFKEMANGIREIGLAMGDGEKKIQPSETNVIKITQERERHRC